MWRSVSGVVSAVARAGGGISSAMLAYLDELQCDFR